MARIVVEVPLSLKFFPDVFMQRVAELKSDQLAGIFPHTIKRLGQLGQTGVALWREKATQVPGTEGRPLRLGTGPDDPMVRLNRTDYANSIHLEPGPENEGPSVTIVSTDPQAVVIEDGGAEIDLHAVLPYAPKARLSKKAHRYLHIPFRHATQEAGAQGQRFQTVSTKWGSNVLPQPVHALMKTKAPVLVTGTYFERGPNVKKGMVQRFLYSKGGRLKADELQALGIDPASLQGQKLVGLFRTGKSRHSQYLTVRTLSEANPDGWRIQPYQAQKVAACVAQSLIALSTDWFDAALKADMEAWVAAAGGQS
jgi:hypothetical protein